MAPPLYACSHAFQARGVSSRTNGLVLGSIADLMKWTTGKPILMEIWRNRQTEFIRVLPALQRGPTKRVRVFELASCRCRHQCRGYGGFNRVKPRAYFPSFATWSWLSTLNTPETPLARIPAMAISASLFTTPVSVTWPFLTMIWIA